MCYGNKMGGIANKYSAANGKYNFTNLMPCFFEMHLIIAIARKFKLQ